MKFRNIWSEFYSRVLPIYGLVSILLLIFSFFNFCFCSHECHGEPFNLSTGLLTSYIFLTVTYFLNSKIVSRYINMSGDNKIGLYIVYIAETIIYVIILRTIMDLIEHGNINLDSLFRSVGFVAIFMTVWCAVCFLLVKAHQKRTNKKLQEYKNQGDDKADADK